jgi:NAD(P)-dependent dehydrogenase (short-subunit alcohol dehydrogenase family)
MRTLDGKIIAITGAGSGFGRATALAVAKRKGVPVILDVNEQGVAETAKLLGEGGARFAQHKLDVRDAARWAEVVNAIVAEFGGVHALVNNAGVMCRPESFLDVAEEHGRFIFDVNFWGMFHGMRAFVPHLAKQQNANIVNVASTLALIGSPMHGVYCAAKAAMTSLTAVVRDELAHTSIRVTTIFPGPSKTNLGRNVPTNSDVQRELNAKNFEKFAITTPETVANKIVGAMLRNRSLVTTSPDGAFTLLMQRLAPVSGHALMGKVYRKVSDPKQFASLNTLKSR